jgi:Rieske Fe-S protein
MGLWAFIDPLTRKRTKPLAFRGDNKGPEGYVRIAPLESLTAGEPPQRFVVIDDKRDSWNFMPNQPVGAIFMQKTGDEKLLVFNATCPHLGCSVSWNGRYFHCPCHNSSFDPDGSKRVTQSGRENPSPRDLDMLQHEVIDGQIWVKYQDFYTGRPTPIPKT